MWRLRVVFTKEKSRVIVVAEDRRMWRLRVVFIKEKSRVIVVAEDCRMTTGRLLIMGAIHHWSKLHFFLISINDYCGNVKEATNGFSTCTHSLTKHSSLGSFQFWFTVCSLAL
jgi:hypothetical protein